jgi:hypothetical protein
MWIFCSMRAARDKQQITSGTKVLQRQDSAVYPPFFEAI